MLHNSSGCIGIINYFWSILTDEILKVMTNNVSNIISSCKIVYSIDSILNNKTAPEIMRHLELLHHFVIQLETSIWPRSSRVLQRLTNEKSLFKATTGCCG